MVMVNSLLWRWRVQSAGENNNKLSKEHVVDTISTLNYTGPRMDGTSGWKEPRGLTITGHLCHLSRDRYKLK